MSKDMKLSHSLVHNAQGGAGGAEGLMMERLLSNRTIQLFGGVDQKLAKKVIGQLFLLEADDPDKPITVIPVSYTHLTLPTKRIV